MSTKELPENAIEFETAKTWVQNWDNSNHSLALEGDLFIRNFLVPKVDLTEVLAEGGVVSIRTYMAIDENDTFHLLIVGVDDKGKVLVDPNLGQYVYDFTKPCPPMCSINEPFR